MADKSVLLWSGGLYSTAILLNRLKAGETVYSIFVDYGQPSVEPQLIAIRRLMQVIRVDTHQYRDKVAPLIIHRILNIGVAGIGITLLGLGIGKAIQLNCDLYIGSKFTIEDEKHDSQLFSKKLAEVGAGLYVRLHFPFAEESNISEYLSYKPFPYDVYTWNCEKPVKEDSQWLPCEECFSCTRSIFGKESSNEDLSV